MNTHKEAISTDDGWLYKPNNMSSLAWPAQKLNIKPLCSEKMARIKDMALIPRLTRLHLDNCKQTFSLQQKQCLNAIFFNEQRMMVSLGMCFPASKFLINNKRTKNKVLRYLCGQRLGTTPTKKQCSWHASKLRQIVHHSVQKTKLDRPMQQQTQFATITPQPTPVRVSLPR